MAKNTTISIAAAIAACDAQVDLIDGGAGAGVIEIYTGTQPADPDEAVGAQVKLAILTCSDPAFGAAADNTGKATATASAITGEDAALDTGTATWFRVSDSNGLAIIDGSVGTSDADMIIANTSITVGEPVNASSWVYNQSQT